MIGDYALNSTDHFARIALDLYARDGKFDIELSDDMLEEVLMSFLQLGCCVERMPSKNVLNVTVPIEVLAFLEAKCLNPPKLCHYHARLTNRGSTAFSPGSGWYRTI